MPQILLKLYDPCDNEVFCWLPYGPEPKKKRTKPQPVKLTPWQQFKLRVKEMVKGEGL